MIVDRFQTSQAEDVARLIKRNLREIISKYYPSAYVEYLIEEYSTKNILENALTQYVFVVTEAGEVIGTGSLADYGTAAKPSYYGTAIFVSPDFQRRGIGRRLMDKVEAQAIEMGADKITVRAAVNARGFYEKLGYVYRDNLVVPDERGNFIMEKSLQRE